MSYFGDFNNLDFFFNEIDDPVIAYPDTPKVFFDATQLFTAFGAGYLVLKIPLFQ